MRIIPKAIFLVLALSALSACSRETPEIPKAGERPVKTVTVKAPSSTRTRVFSGMVNDALETILSFRVAGKILELPANLGMKVRPKDVIARLDSTDFDLEIKRIKAKLERVRAEFVNASTNLNRIQSLYDRNVISKSELDKAETEFESLKAELNSVRQSLDIAQRKREYTILKSPVAGSIAKVEVEVEQNVKAGQPIVMLASGDKMEMEIGLPDSLIGDVAVGDPATIELHAFPDVTFQGSVGQVGVEPGRLSTYPVKIFFSTTNPRIKPGMVGDAALEFPARQADFILVPPEAVVGNPDGSHHAWIVDIDTNIVQQRTVTIGDLTSEGLQIFDGLNPGDELIIRGVHAVKQGQKVKLMNSLQ